jgi:membrane-associated protease RseP (regulator of RpoE activity)
MASKFFPNNEHLIERVVRVVGGLGIVSLAFVGPATPWAWLGLVPVITGLAGTCPIYTLLGVSTCAVHPRASSDKTT